ncbi:spermidine synthase [Psychromicrobium xiongbiense]|uniref:spermidine synthase n=1 Tax=Psychromicrobium xiongbiense TaxID=3051184 RepID=UPI002552E3FA|nr:fused MFS/spermidine synthase [Psychromicrobium sp. YIM S02556]
MVKPVPQPVAGQYAIESGLAELEPEPGNSLGWLLKINGMQSSHVDLGDPFRLDFEYMRWIMALVEDRWPLAGSQNAGSPNASERLRVLHLGGAACSMARYLVARYPQSRNTVVEIDGRLATLVREWFALPQAPLLKIRVGEARQVTESLNAGSRDVVIRDVFSGRFTPVPLTTVEFVQQVKRVLSPDGIYLLNCGDSPALGTARREAATLLDAFAHTAIVADPPMLKGRRYGNIVMAGSDVPLAQSPQLARALLGGGLPATLWTDAQVRDFARKEPVLKD